MAKELHNDVLDAALDKIATCTHLTFCSSQPANYAGIAAVALISATLTAGDGNGDYTIADGDTSGRKITVAAQSSLTPSGDGTVTYAVLDDGTTLLAATTVTSQAVTTAQTWNSPAFDIEIADPT